MADTALTPLLERIVATVRAEIDPEFEFASLGEVPWSPFSRAAVSEPIAIVTTAGLHLRGDPPFDARSRLGDTSFRVVPRGTGPDRLDLLASYVDRRYIPGDPEVALPLGALEALHARGLAGPPAARHASFVGGIVRPLPGLANSAANLFDLLREDGVGSVILLPTCSLCVQTVCVLARELESRGLPTVALTMIPELTRIVGAPRALAVRFPFGAPCGDPGNAPLHEAVLREALRIFSDASVPGTIRESALAWRRGPEARRD